MIEQDETYGNSVFGFSARYMDLNAALRREQRRTMVKALLIFSAIGLSIISIACTIVETVVGI